MVVTRSQSVRISRIQSEEACRYSQVKTNPQYVIESPQLKQLLVVHGLKVSLVVSQKPVTVPRQIHQVKPISKAKLSSLSAKVEEKPCQKCSSVSLSLHFSEKVPKKPRKAILTLPQCVSLSSFLLSYLSLFSHFFLSFFSPFFYSFFPFFKNFYSLCSILSILLRATISDFFLSCSKRSARPPATFARAKKIPTSYLLTL